MNLKPNSMRLSTTSCMQSMSRFPITVIFIFFQLLHSNVAAQEFEVTQIPMPFKEFPNSINGMSQDNYGNIWIAARDNGLFKYDGTNMVHYENEKNNPNSLVTNRLECIIADKDGTVWIATYTDGLIHFDPVENTFTNYQYDEKDSRSIRSNSITALAQDQSGGIWIGTTTGLDYFNPTTKEFKHDFTQDTDEQNLQKEHIRSLYIDKAGVLWIGCGTVFYGEPNEGGLYKFDNEKSSVTRYLSSSSPNSLIDNRVKAIFEDSRGVFWVGTAGDGLHTMNREEGTFIRHTYDPEYPHKLSRPPEKDMYGYAVDHISFISEDAQGFIWIGTFEAGLNRYDPLNKTVQHFGSDETGVYHIPNDSFWTSLITHDHLLWAGSWDWSRIFKISTLNKISNTDLNKPIFSFAEDNYGNIYMGSENEILREKVDQSIDTILRLGNDGQVVFLEKSDKGNIWISSTFGLHQYNPRSGKLVTYKKEDKTGLQTDNIWVTRQLNSDSLLVGTSIGLYLLDLKSGQFIQYPYLDPVSNLPKELWILRIYIDSRKNVWIGTRSNSLKKLDLASGRFIDYKILEEHDEYITDIYEDDSQRLYVGTGRGLSQYNVELDRFETIIDMFGLMKEVPIAAITAESDSILWLESSRGLFKYNILTKSTSFFGRSWGYNPDAGSHAGLFKSSRGYYYKGTYPGYYKFRFSDFNKKLESELQPFLGELLIDNKPVVRSKDNAGDTVLQLPHNQNNISFELGYINYLSNPGDFMMQYNLSGFEDLWREGAHGEMVRFHALPPGKYDFKIRAMDVYGDWQETSQTFQIRPPWWSTWWAYSAYALVFITLVLTVHKVQRKRIINKERALARDKELAQAKEIEKAYSELKATQSQLIHSEKMASLGELTAGIAHEIQNPLNFVNNFSEVNKELLVELNEEIQKGNFDEVKALAKDVTDNEEKIIFHGKRADAIVKGMLQHSRSSSGVKEPTDINALCDEYLRLAYHGLRAKDKSFNATMKTDFDATIGNVNVIPQDMGRVVLNLITNAFYAVNECKKLDQTGYEPTVTVTIKKEGDKAQISVKDNGNGIPKKVLDKIFQPFFTTKPTGQGTGLGLSLSYDIVKAHGGELNVKTKENEGTEFVVVLPIN